MPLELFTDTFVVEGVSKELLILTVPPEFLIASKVAVAPPPPLMFELNILVVPDDAKNPTLLLPFEFPPVILP